MHTLRRRPQLLLLLLLILLLFLLLPPPLLLLLLQLLLPLLLALLPSACLLMTNPVTLRLHMRARSKIKLESWLASLAETSLGRSARGSNRLRMSVREALPSQQGS